MKYRHKKVNATAELLPDNNYYRVSNEHHPVPAWLIEGGSEWELLQEATLEYEIVAYRHKDLSQAIGKDVVLRKDTDSKYYEVASNDTTNEYEIYSVKRLSDGVVFSIGDRIKSVISDNLGQFTIAGFEVQGAVAGGMAILTKEGPSMSLEVAVKVTEPTGRAKLLEKILDKVTSVMHGVSSMKAAKDILLLVEQAGPVEDKKEKPVLVTEDGQILYKGFQPYLYWVNINDWCIGDDRDEDAITRWECTSYDTSNYKWFSTEAARTDHMVRNRKLFSLADLLELDLKGSDSTIFLNIEELESSAIGMLADEEINGVKIN